MSNDSHLHKCLWALLMVTICCSCGRTDINQLEVSTRAEIAFLSLGIDTFRVDCGRYPTVQEGFSVLVTNSGVQGWHGPYIEKLRDDAWRTPFQYGLVDGKPRITSAGKDRLFHTADDISN